VQVAHFMPSSASSLFIPRLKLKQPNTETFFPCFFRVFFFQTLEEQRKKRSQVSESFHATSLLQEATNHGEVNLKFQARKEGFL
jgi:hypothetical protein